MLFQQESLPWYPNFHHNKQKEGSHNPAAPDRLLQCGRFRGEGGVYVHFSEVMQTLWFSNRGWGESKSEADKQRKSLSVDKSRVLWDRQSMRPIIWIVLWPVCVFMLWVTTWCQSSPLPVCKIPSSPSSHSAIMVWPRSRPQLPLSDSDCLFLSMFLWQKDHKKILFRSYFVDIFKLLNMQFLHVLGNLVEIMFVLYYCWQCSVA